MELAQLSCPPCIGAYLIENDTNQAIHFGQSGTAEDIFVKARATRMYSWRSWRGRGDHRLRFRGDKMHYDWSKPASVDRDGTQHVLLTIDDTPAWLRMEVRRFPAQFPPF